jgi:hypothetical protein
MYTPNISGESVCGEYHPPLTDLQRQQALDFEALLDTMNCLYSREFKPLYSESLCPCTSCYTSPVWNRIILHASNMNTKVIWNDIIKRWEPTKFDQDFTEDVDTISNYEFRNYKSIYDIEIDAESPRCSDCEPMAESKEGAGFTKAHKGLDNPNPCNATKYIRDISIPNNRSIDAL